MLKNITMVKIKGKKLVKQGNSYYLNVPVSLVESGILAKGKKYDLLIKEAVKNAAKYNIPRREAWCWRIVFWNNEAAYIQDLQKQVNFLII